MDSQEQSLFPRIVMAAAVVFTILAFAYFFDANLKQDNLDDPLGFSLKGKWHFHNGSLDLNVPAAEFSTQVDVPASLLPQLNSPLAQTFWYQKTVTLPSSFLTGSVPLVIFLGTIKGEHQVYWNGELLGAGGKLVLAEYPLPRKLIRPGENDLRIKVARLDHLFPGIVHMMPVTIGRSTAFEGIREKYMFDSGVKPLILATFKFSLFFLFAALALAVPRKQEYFSFAVFMLSSAITAALYSRFIPSYFDFYLRNFLTFFATTISFSVIPWMSAGILRLKVREQAYSKIYGFVCGAVFIAAMVWIQDREKLISLYQTAGKFLPLLVAFPCSAYCLWKARSLPAALKHRKIQIYSYSFLLLAGSVAWSSSAGTLFAFGYLKFPEIWDMGLLSCLALCATLDLRHSGRRSERAALVVPKWFNHFLASGMSDVTLELPMVAMAVDTVGYTKLLAGLSSEEKSVLHANIRARMAPLVENFGAQKLSDRGDGALFGWDFYGTEEDKRSFVRSAIAAAEHLVTDGENAGGIRFRVGIAAGIVRGELKGSETSFLGEPLNAASRLEALGKPGTVLLHDSVLPYVSESSLSDDSLKIELKGVEYNARPLKRAA